MSRDLAWDGCLNVRDLGGMPLEGGGTTAFRVFVRADNLGALSPDGWRALDAYGIERVVDLRWPEEVAEDPPRDAGIDVVHVPLLGPTREGAFADKYDGYLDAAEDVGEYYRWSYLEFLEEFRPSFGVAVEALAEGRGTAVFHCMGGKDRTGLVAALLLRLAGVPRDVVAADWAVSEHNLADAQPAWVEQAADEAERQRRIKFGLAPESAMREVLDELEGRHGGARGYLEAAGAGGEALSRIGSRLRGEGR